MSFFGKLLQATAIAADSLGEACERGARKVGSLRDALAANEVAPKNERARTEYRKMLIRRELERTRRQIDADLASDEFKESRKRESLVSRKADIEQLLAHKYPVKDQLFAMYWPGKGLDILSVVAENQWDAELVDLGCTTKADAQRITAKYGAIPWNF